MPDDTGSAMAPTRGARISRPAQLGLIALTFMVIAAIALYFVAHVLRGGSGYQIAVRFASAAGVSSGAQVTLNGVDVGTVSKVLILPDASVDFIITVFGDTAIPKGARFSVRPALTGSPTVTIDIPPGIRSSMLAKRVLPISEQPVGAVPLSLDAMMAQGRVLANRAQRMLAQARPYGGRLTYHLQHARASASGTMQGLRGTMPSVMGSLHSTIAKAKADAQQAQSALRRRDQAKIAAIASSFQQSSIDMKRTADALGPLKRDPALKENVRYASAQLRAVTGNMAQLSRDMQMITGNAQTKAELRDAGARLRAILHKL